MPEDHLEAISFKAPSLEELNVLLEGYKFESFIAQGGMGAVYMANQTSLDRQVAIKILPRELGDDVKFRESFQAEARHMAKLNHPNLIGIYDFGDIDGMLYIIMEYVKGKSLHDSAHGKAIIQETAAAIIRDICLGLSDAHDAGILHRDIKPANILLGKKARPKVGDFGLARPAENTESGVIYGTPGYAAPEVLNAPDEVDVRADIYAVGVMFYELLTGSMPKKSYEPVYELAEVDKRFDKIVRKAIRRNPVDRYESAERMADAISSVLKELKSESGQTINPLLTGAQKTSVAPKLAATVTGGGSAAKLAAPVVEGSGGAKLSAAESSSESSSAAGASSASAVGSNSAGNNGTRNILIILILLAAVYGALQYKSWKEKDVARINAESKAEEDEKQKIRDRVEAERAKERRLATEERRREQKRREQLKKDNKPRITDEPDNADTVIGPGSKEYPMKQLENSRFELVSGEREKSLFPESVVFRDNEQRAIMFIDKLMTWDEADQWASNYGAHLAVCSGKSDIAQYSKMTPENGSAWLGGGNNGNKGWVWIDGSEWKDSTSLATTNKRAFITVSNFGNLTVENKQDKKLPFFIEWKMEKNTEGEINPGSLEERLARTIKEIGGQSVNPKFPLGSLNIGPRTYCPVYRTMTHHRANQLAVKSGGHLLVISNQDELIYLEASISRMLRPNTECWIGGSKSNDLWQWLTGETWVKIPWKNGYPNEGTKLQLITGKSIKLKDAGADDKAPMFIIEWSADKDKVVKNADVNADSNDGRGLKKINDWHEAKLQKEIIAAEKKFTANVRKLTFDLEFYLKGLPRNVRAEEQVEVNEIHAKAKDKDRIPGALDGQGPSKKVRDITAYGVKKQLAIKADLDEDIEKLRKLYIKHMLNYKADMAKKGQKSIIDAVDESIDSAGKNAANYREHFNN